MRDTQKQCETFALCRNYQIVNGLELQEILSTLTVYKILNDILALMNLCKNKENCPNNRSAVRKHFSLFIHKPVEDKRLYLCNRMN